ncbi:double-strand break repair helicase AddA [Pontivivens ytuae]|uniref:DNA 3'-5' helicase n=1 Tax=Pontivivens ytuae TaxID=2789856 RepID=A0A7S9QB38_9RHOB|nr:double-strand break repair helicase AddA [Pontivivens ytuae]QPH52758.1 double-strand break repair helicase AddA [Pontivivens ytuae]
MSLSDASRAQNSASTPAGSVWVGANAGSGKTRVLTDRVARLLLHGADPQRILCLTYTKAAAAEMKNRLFRRLGQWSMMPDEALRAELAALEEPGDDLPRARRLFAAALEVPGELKIQTIHAFCAAVLRRFPVEAGVPPRFREMDDREAAALREEILDALAEERPETFAEMALHVPGDGPDGLIGAILGTRDAFGSFDVAACERALGGDTQGPVAVVDEDARALLRRLAGAMAAAGTATEQEKGVETVGAITDAEDAARRQEEAEKFLLFGASAKEPHGPKRGKIGTRGARGALGDADLDALDRLAEAVAEARTRRIARITAARTKALHDFAEAFLDRYAAAKAAGGLLDFDDLITRTRALLTEADMAAWVLYRLDGGIEHILVDEAQDTSPEQWQVIEALTPEFYAGAGAGRVDRTLFVVGDEKQSIYSFQGAQPRAFGEMREMFGTRLAEAEKPFARVALDYSFRSAPAILRLTDAVFEVPGRGDVTDAVHHLAYDDEKPGRVDLWPYLVQEKGDEGTDWWRAIDEPSPDNAQLRLAEQVADAVHGMIGRAPLPGREGARVVGAGDVLILVQRRGVLFNALIREMKARGVPVSGADRMRLGEELAVRDLLALMRFATTPDDDLSLAAALRSPLFDVDEAGLYQLAHGRGRERLIGRVQAEPGLAEAAAFLQDLRGQADFIRPYEFLDRILTRHGGRRRFLARLGHEAVDGIDELLAQALAYERERAPSLTGFLDWIDADGLEIKREQEEGAGEVRVMTVHGAKGLEAPVVILPDTGPRRAQTPPPVVKVDPVGPVWQAKPRPDPVSDAIGALGEKAARESERLLYVALTRAEHWLIVAGAGPELKEATAEQCWYGMVAAAMERLPAEAVGEGCRITENWPDAGAAEEAVATEAVALPDWAHAPVTAAERVRLVSPSDLGGAHALPGEGDPAELAKARGTAIHDLIERMAELPPEQRASVRSDGLPDALAEAVHSEALAVVQDPALAHFFGPDSLAEVPACGDLGGRRMFGRVDRLVVETDRVLIVDFKSNRVVPERPEDVPEAILRQMGAYVAALTPAFDVPVVPLVLWTAERRLMELPHALVNAALTRATAP